MPHVHKHPSRPSTLKACGFMAVSSFIAAGCVPPWAEELTDGERQELSAQLDSMGEHMDFIEDIVERIDPEFLFVKDKDVESPTATDVRAELEEVVEIAYTMLDNDRVFVYRGDTFPDESDYSEHVKGFAQWGGLDAAVFLAQVLNKSEMLIHEFTHFYEKSRHTDAIEVSALNRTMEPQIFTSLVASDSDQAYRNDMIMSAFQSLNDSVFTEYGTGEDGIREWWYAPAPDYDNFAIYHNRLLEHIDLIQNRPEEWGEGFVTTAYYSEYFPGMLDIWDGNIIRKEWEAMGLTPEEVAEILSLPSTDYLRAHALERTTFILNEHAEANPEYYKQYQKEMLAETQLQQVEVHPPATRARRMMR